jgi:hypothetical protein
MPLPFAIKELVATRAGRRCEYCLSQEEFSPSGFSIEHIIPRSGGGTSDPDNLAFACQSCNNFKYDATMALDPVTGQGAPLFDPRRDVWGKHFCWTSDSAILIGLTPAGRATISRLHLNRAGVVRLRRVLRLMGRHPPHD